MIRAIAISSVVGLLLIGCSTDKNTTQTAPEPPPLEFAEDLGQYNLTDDQFAYAEDYVRSILEDGGRSGRGEATLLVKEVERFLALRVLATETDTDCLQTRRDIYILRSMAEHPQLHASIAEFLEEVNELIDGLQVTLENVPGSELPAYTPESNLRAQLVLSDLEQLCRTVSEQQRQIAEGHAETQPSQASSSAHADLEFADNRGQYEIPEERRRYAKAHVEMTLDHYVATDNADEYLKIRVAKELEAVEAFVAIDRFSGDSSQRVIDARWSILILTKMAGHAQLRTAVVGSLADCESIVRQLTARLDKSRRSEFKSAHSPEANLRAKLVLEDLSELCAYLKDPRKGKVQAISPEDLSNAASIICTTKTQVEQETLTEAKDVLVAAGSESIRPIIAEVLKKRRQPGITTQPESFRPKDGEPVADVFASLLKDTKSSAAAIEGVGKLIDSACDVRADLVEPTTRAYITEVLHAILRQLGELPDHEKAQLRELYRDQSPRLAAVGKGMLEEAGENYQYEIREYFRTLGSRMTELVATIDTLED